MFFYDDFIKKLDKNIQGQGIEKFGLEAKRTAVWLGTGIPFLAAGLMELYISYMKNFAVTDLAAGIIFILLSIRHLKLFFGYKIVLDFNEKRLKSKDISFDFENVKSCVLKEQAVGKRKKLEAVLDVITKDGQQIIIPLMMNNKIRFVSLLKNEMGRKFAIER